MNTANLLLASVLVTSSLHASADTYLDCYNDTQHCERVLLVDFDGNLNVQNSSANFLDWNTVLQVRYTGSEGVGSTLLIGSEGAYNAQGVTGTTKNQFRTGEYLIATYKNTTDAAITFSPRISFDDPDSIVFGPTGVWTTMGTTVIGAQSSGEVLLRFDDSYGALPFTSLVNINTNYKGNRGLYLDKIEYNRRIDPVTSTDFPCNETVCNKLVAFDLSQPTLADIKRTSQLASFSEHYSTNFTYTTRHWSGAGLTIAKGVTNGDYLYYAIKNPQGTHHFKAGEKIIVEVANFQDFDTVLNGYISFDDPDTKPWGVVGTWKKLPQVVAPARHINTTIEFTFDQDTAGDFNTINVTIVNDNTNGNLVLKKVTYLTKQSFKATF